jgi:hypothetical protein
MILSDNATDFVCHLVESFCYHASCKSVSECMPLAVQDCVDPEGNTWTFTIKPWSNGGPDKVVYILDKTGAGPWDKVRVQSLMEP